MRQYFAVVIQDPIMGLRVTFPKHLGWSQRRRREFRVSEDRAFRDPTFL
jgi:hypothetical protein